MLLKRSAFISEGWCSHELGSAQLHSQDSQPGQDHTSAWYMWQPSRGMPRTLITHGPQLTQKAWLYFKKLPMQEATEAQLEQEQELHAAELRSAAASLLSLMAEQAVAYEAQLAAAAQHGSAAAGLDVGGTSSRSTAFTQTEEQASVMQHLEEEHGARVADLQAQLAEAQMLPGQERELQENALEQASTACCPASVPEVHLHSLHRSSRAAAFPGD